MLKSMEPVLILEQSRLADTMECVTDYILVINPFTGEQKNLTRAEAREMITAYDLKRFVIKHRDLNTGQEVLGAVWDTRTHAFKRRYCVASFVANLKRTLGVSGKTGEARKQALAEVAEKKDLFRKQLHRAIHQMFNEPFEEEEL